MKHLICLIIALILSMSILSFTCSGERMIFEMRSKYWQQYALGFDKGYAAAWNAHRCGDALHKWVRNWKHWVIYNPAFVRGYEKGVEQAIKDSSYLKEKGYTGLSYFQATLDSEFTA